MITSKHHAYFSPEAYLELERLSPIKHEYIQGQMVAMAGASKAHVIITGNLADYKSEHRDGEIVPMAGGTTNHNKLALNFAESLKLARR